MADVLETNQHWLLVRNCGRCHFSFAVLLQTRWPCCFSSLQNGSQPVCNNCKSSAFQILSNVQFKRKHINLAQATAELLMLRNAESPDRGGGGGGRENS